MRNSSDDPTAATVRKIVLREAKRRATSILAPEVAAML